MTKYFIKGLALSLLIVGLLTFLHPSLGNLVYLDMFAGLIYLILGAVGLKLSFTKNIANRYLANYCLITGFISLLLLLLGLSWPNFKDIFHLEPAENIW
ncbi:MAG: hypothetical protein ACOZAJ_02320, partial [Patescibacteria group bacterium]